MLPGTTPRARIGQIISAERVGGLGKETFLAFLGSENWRHTMGLGRGISFVEDMPRLSEALALLVDPQLPLRARLDRLRPPVGKR